jgi:spoIIIJ-associated protein
MSNTDSIEITASTVEQAIADALAKLGAAEDDVVIEVLAAPRSGVLGLGARDARVRVTRRPPVEARSGVTAPPPAPPAPRTPQVTPSRPEPRPVQAERRETARQESPQTPETKERIEATDTGEPVSPPARPQRERDNRGRRADGNESGQAQSRERENRRGRGGQSAQGGQGRGRSRSDQRRVNDYREDRPPQESKPVPEYQNVGGEDMDEVREQGPRAEVDLEAEAREAAEVLRQILDLMNEKGEIVRGVDDNEALELDIKGDGSGLLIGRHGQTLDALEYVLNRIVARRVKDAIPILLDTESYRARRRQQLHRMALSMGERAKREHQVIKMDPMPPRERRIIHLALKDDPMVSTRSAGEGFLRSVEIVPTESRRESGDNRRDQGRDRDRERGRSAIGEQGGFKHGQKRLF